MARIPIEKYRNIGIAAHVDAGKTTTMAYLFSPSATKLVRCDGAAMDWMARNKRGITALNSDSDPGLAAATVRRSPHQHHRHRSLTTIEVERSMRVDDSVVVFCGSSGVEPQSDSVWRQADKYGVPRICSSTRWTVTARTSRVVGQIRNRLGANAVNAVEHGH